jgi:hypothetical protein
MIPISGYFGRADHINTISLIYYRLGNRCPKYRQQISRVRSVAAWKLATYRINKDNVASLNKLRLQEGSSGSSKDSLEMELYLCSNRVSFSQCLDQPCLFGHRKMNSPTPQIGALRVTLFSMGDR